MKLTKMKNNKLSKSALNGLSLVIGVLVINIFSACNSVQRTKPVEKPNILFIAVDDLKPILGCYGNDLIKTPNIDRLAANGTVFSQNYCQQAVCGPTRASIMTGMRPDHTKIWDLKTRMRDVNPDIMSLPQYLITQGYSTQGIGKIYDPRCVDKELDVPSWSVPFYKNSDDYYSKITGEPAYYYQLPETKSLIEKYILEAKDQGLDAKDIRDYVLTKVKPAVENADVPDNAYIDGANTLHAKDILVELSKKSEPFFLAVGITKPHLPFVSPKKYWDLYNREDMPVAEYQKQALNSPSIGYHKSGELRSYTDIPELASFTDQKTGIGLPLDKQKELIHGYYAAVSYADAQVGILLNTLDSLGLSENTIIVLWGDHGWHLGDHDLWCKHTNFEQATHAPLIISAPWIKASKTASASEFVDVFPTLCDLSGLDIPVQLDGNSLVPIMKNPEMRVKDYSVSQYPRSGNYEEANRLGYSDGKYMGYSIRTEQYRYTIWMSNDYRSIQAFDEKLMVANELYDYKKDPNETVNVVNEKEYAEVVKKMHAEMIGFMATQLENK